MNVIDDEHNILCYFNVIFLLSCVQQEEAKMNDELQKEEEMWKEKFKQHEVLVFNKYIIVFSPFKIKLLCLLWAF